jgi:2'-5' RNA ligase
MRLPPIVRIFFAIDLPADAKESLGQFIASLKKKSRTHAIRWAKPESLHITLQFLAEVKSEHIEELLGNVRNQVKGIAKSALRIGNLRLFPNPYRPRVIVVDIMHNDGLSHLASTIGEGIKASRYPVEIRPFHPHLTIGRLKYPTGINLDFLSDIEMPDLGLLEMKEFVLFRSEPQQEGSRYTVLETIGL